MADFLALLAARKVSVDVISGLAEIDAFGAKEVWLADESVAELQRLHAGNVAVVDPRLADRKRPRPGDALDQLVLAA